MLREHGSIQSRNYLFGARTLLVINVLIQTQSIFGPDKFHAAVVGCVVVSWDIPSILAAQLGSSKFASFQDQSKGCKRD